MELNPEQVCQITVPEVLNPAAFAEFRDRLEAVSSGHRVVVLRGSPQIFCRGMDLAGMHESPVTKEGLTLFAATMLHLRRLPQAVIAAVEGDAIGGGAGIAAAADLVIAEEHVRFGLPEAMFGLVPAVIMPFLRERINAQKLRAWILATESLTAEKAAALGLADQVIPSGTMEKTLARTVRRFTRCVPASAALIKRELLNGGAGLKEELDKMVGITAAAVREPDVLNRIAAWQTGETPWAG